MYKRQEEDGQETGHDHFQEFLRVPGKLLHLPGRDDGKVVAHPVSYTHLDVYKRQGLYLQGMGVDRKDFNSFGSRRGNDRVMTRGTFANVRIKNPVSYTHLNKGVQFT